MRTTVTLDSDTEQIIRRRMRERDMTFKEALNDTIRGAIASQASRQTFSTKTVAMGESRVNLDRALQVAGELEDNELLRKMRSGA